MAIHGVLAKAVARVATGAAGAAAYDLLRKAVAKVPIREASVTTAEWALRGTRKAEETAETARLNIADVMAETRERIGEEVPPPAVGDAEFLMSALALAITGDVRRAMTMLLVAYPCAVGLATPTAISATIGNGARRGILIKGGAHLEEAGRVDTVVFDKAGTLTHGRPIVTNIVAFHDDWQPEQVLAYAASSEIHSRHPAGKSGHSLH